MTEPKIAGRTLDEIDELCADCTCKSVGFCESWGCKTVEALVAEVRRLRASNRALMAYAYKPKPPYFVPGPPSSGTRAPDTDGKER